VDDLSRCWGTLFNTINDARKADVIRPQKFFNENSKNLDWLAVTIFVSQATQGEVTAVRQAMEEDYKQVQKEAMQLGQQAVVPGAADDDSAAKLNVPVARGPEDQEFELNLVRWLTCPSRRLIPWRPTFEHFSKMFVFMQAEVDPEYRSTGNPSKK
jgi:hypothetical protein